MIVWCVATLSVRSGKLSAKEIARILESEGSHQVEKGSRVSMRPTITRVYDNSVWSLDSELGDSETVESHIEELLVFAEAKAEALESLSPDCDVEVWISFRTCDDQGGFTLDEQMLKRLAKLNIKMQVSFMGNRDEEEEN